MNNIKRILSGIQPTGNLHLGNYIGALKQWVSLTENMKYESYFTIVDLHALTNTNNILNKLNNNNNNKVINNIYEDTLDTTALYLACGLNKTIETTNKCHIFVQSHISQHSELMWILSCITPLPWLYRMTQYKDKSQLLEQYGKKDGFLGLGLLSYPILMASDILLYKSDLIPVGDDQKQHIELTIDIAKKFHYLFKNNYNNNSNNNNINSNNHSGDIFKIPKAIISNDTGRIMSLTNGKNKMSKSDLNDNSRINLIDKPELIKKKIKKSKTDSIKGISWDPINRPETTNLINIMSIVTNLNKNEIVNKYQYYNWGDFKNELSDAIISYLLPIQDEFYRFRNDELYLNEILKNGRYEAENIAENTLDEVRGAIGLLKKNI